MPPHFFKKGETVTKRSIFACSDGYSEAVDGNCDVWNRPYVFQQDGAPVYTSHLIQNWLSDNVDMFWSKEIWPPNNPDLNPLDYYVWNVVERITNKSQHPNVTSLRTAIEAAFVGMDSATLQRACERFRPRIEAVIQTNGGYIE